MYKRQLNAKQAVIQNDDGDVKIVRGRFKNLELKDDLGDLKIKDVIFANSQIEMADGDIQAENVTFTGKNEIRSSLGDITPVSYTHLTEIQLTESLKGGSEIDQRRIYD